MAGLDKDARMMLESSCDSAINQPDVFDKMFKKMLRDQGIEPNLETILSMIAGFLLGNIWSYYNQKYNREMKFDEIDDFYKLMKRRAWEIRQVFIGTRIEE